MITHEQSSSVPQVSVVVGAAVDPHVIGAIKNVDSTIDVHHDRHLDTAARQRVLADAEIMFGIPPGTPTQLGGCCTVLRDCAGSMPPIRTSLGGCSTLSSVKKSGNAC